jgi:protein phosphatase 2C family protein 2/3
MEDAHLAVPSIPGLGWEKMAAFGVMDGHGGSEVAKFCAYHLPNLIGQQPSGNIGKALTTAFYSIDNMLTRDHNVDSYHQGCTACVAIVTEERIVVGNAGDSRAVLSRGGYAVPLSQDHKPNLRSEQRRIERAGGTIVNYGEYGGGPRVQGDLNLSRALGDHRHKQDVNLHPAEQIISSEPEIKSFLRQPNDEFMILACDGVWDMMSNEGAVEFLSRRLQHGPGPNGEVLPRILEELLDECCSPDLHSTLGKGGDNMTAVLVHFDRSVVTWGMKHIPGILGCYL